MSDLIIPDNRKKSFEILLNLNKDQRYNLIKHLENAPQGLLKESLSKYLTEKLEISFDNVQSIIELLFDLYRVKDVAKIDELEFTEDIIKTLKNDGLTPFSDDWVSFQDDLYKLISLKSSIGLTQRARRLLSEYENIFLETRILTDIRPVFKTNNSEEIETSTIVHQMKITYHHDSDEKNIFFALDNEDLGKLKEALIRAEKKENILKKTFSSSTFINFQK